MIRVAIFAVCVFASSCAGTRGDVASAPDPDDVAVRAAVDTLYAVVSGEKGVARPWERLKELFVPEGYFCISGVGRDGKPRSRTFSVDAFVEGWRFCVVAWSEESPGIRLPAALRDH